MGMLFIRRQGKLCILDCGPAILKILHNSPDFMPYVVFLAAPGAERIQQQDDFERQHGYSSRTLAVSIAYQVSVTQGRRKIKWIYCISYFEFQFDRMSSIRYSSRRARTLESIASLYEVKFYFFRCSNHHRIFKIILLGMLLLYRRMTRDKQWKKVKGFKGCIPLTLT